MGRSQAYLNRLSVRRKAFRKAHPEVIRAREKASRLKHIEKARQRSREYHQKHRDRLRLYRKEWQKKNSDACHLKKMQRIHGLEPGEYAKKFEIQQGLCAICREPERLKDRRSGMRRRLSVDHNHATGKNRGLLCGACNAALGHMRDNVRILRAAIDYLNLYTESE